MKKQNKFDFERVSNFIVSIGAAIVILGALAKLIHHPLADIMLTIGLCTEAAIFAMYAFMPPQKDNVSELLEKLLAAERSDTRKIVSTLEKHEGGGASVDTKPIETLNENLQKIFNLKR